MFLLIAALAPHKTKAINVDAAPTTESGPGTDTVIGHGYFLGDDGEQSLAEQGPTPTLDDPSDDVSDTDDEKEWPLFVRDTTPREMSWPLYARVADDGAMHAAGLFNGTVAPRESSTLLDLLRHRDPGTYEPVYL